MKTAQTTWMLFECEMGARWSSTSEDYSNSLCSFSGCLENNHKVKKIKTTTKSPFKWFKSPYETWEHSQKYKSIIAG